MATSPAAAAESSIQGVAAIGRYFTVVSLVPSVVFAAYLTLLVRSGAWWNSEVNLTAAFVDVKVTDVALLAFVSVLAAIALHPLQVTFIQVLEGFWGSSKIGRKFASTSIIRHQRRAANLRRTAVRAGHAEQLAKEHADSDESGSRKRRVTVRVTQAEAWRLYSSYPRDDQDIMPTLLGNILRRYERLAGTRYGLDSIATVPRLMQVANASDVAYVQNQRTQMDMALRSSVLALAATVLTLVFMWDHGLWLLLSMAPYLVAYLSYRGATVVAREYGTALAVLIDLNRFALYERMRLPMPEDSEEEQESNSRLMMLLGVDNNVRIEKRLNSAYFDYVHPEAEDESKGA